MGALLETGLGLAPTMCPFRCRFNPHSLPMGPWLFPDMAMPVPSVYCTEMPLLVFSMRLPVTLPVLRPSIRMPVRRSWILLLLRVKLVTPFLTTIPRLMLFPHG